MTAYVIVDIDVSDTTRYEDYKRLAKPAVEHYGGRYIVRGGATETLEGDWSPQRVVLLEFPDMAAARRFYDSTEYAEARRVRAGVATMRMIAVAGVE